MSLLFGGLKQKGDGTERVFFEDPVFYRIGGSDDGRLPEIGDGGPEIVDGHVAFERIAVMA
jgi:hypothetical protein